MKGTFSYCRTKEAIEWIESGDVMLNLETEEYFKKENRRLYVSSDSFSWNVYNGAMESFPPYVEWRSLSNLHYYHDLKGNDSEELKFLTTDHRILSETDSKADKKRKRWFIGTKIDL